MVCLAVSEADAGTLRQSKVIELDLIDSVDGGRELCQDATGVPPVSHAQDARATFISGARSEVRRVARGMRLRSDYYAVGATAD